MADDDDVIAVDIVPKLDEAATEKETGKLRDKLKKNTRGAAKIEPELDEKAADRVSAKLRDKLKDGTKGFHEGLDSELKKASGLMDRFRSGSVERLKTSLKGLSSADVKGSLDKLAQTFGQELPGPIQAVTDKSNDLLSTYKNVKGTVGEVVDQFSAVAKSAPAMGSAISGAIGEIAGAAELAAGPLAAFAATLAAIDYGWQKGLQRGRTRIGPGGGHLGDPLPGEPGYDDFMLSRNPRFYPKSLPKSTLPPTPGLPPPGMSWQMGSDGKWVAKPMLGSPGTVAQPGTVPLPPTEAPAPAPPSVYPKNFMGPLPDEGQPGGATRGPGGVYKPPSAPYGSFYKGWYPPEESPDSVPDDTPSPSRRTSAAPPVGRSYALGPGGGGAVRKFGPTGSPGDPIYVRLATLSGVGTGVGGTGAGTGFQWPWLRLGFQPPIQDMLGLGGGSLPGGASAASLSGSVSTYRGSSSHASLVDFTRPQAPSISGPEDLPGAGASVANLYRFAQSLVGTPYSQPLRNDCSGMVSELASVAVGLPAPGAGGRFTTVNEGQRLAALGFRTGIGGPNDFSVGWYDHGGGNFGHTAATLPGGINAESGGSHGSFLLGPGAAGASSPQFDHHMFLPMGPESTLGAPPVRATLTGYGIPNTPAPGMPGLPPLPGLGGYPPPPTQGNNYSPTSQQPLGHGSGVGVGGGIIGLAEQAGAMAAGAMSFGGGAIAAQIAEQEINLAVQKGGQAAAVLAKAPMETFGLHGGQMGAPSTGSGGWISQILGGFIGQQFSLPNTAGAGTQAPKQPQKQQDDDGAPGGKSGTPAGPAGTKEDPLHVKSVTPATISQGGATSAMNATGVMSGVVV